MRTAFVALLLAGALFGQETPLNRLKREAAQMKAQPVMKVERSQVTALHLALRDWIEAHLPLTARSSVEFRNVEETLQAELKKSGMSLEDAPEGDFDAPRYGYVGFEMKWLPELSDGLFFIASVSVPCGTDDAIYLYRFDANGRERVFEDRPPNNFGYGDAQIELSDIDSQGRRLLLTHYMSVQCASTWMGMAYNVYRLGLPVGAHEMLVSGEHGFWLGNDGPIFVLKPDELMIEFLDASLDGGIHNRTEVQRYGFAAGVRRVDPVAFQPQDFVEEWLTRPWSEMQSRSDSSTRWVHDAFQDAAKGYVGALPCAERPNRWLIVLTLTVEPRIAHFLVHDLGNYRYQMESVSTSRPSGCPGGGDASDKHPWLSEAELKALQ